MIKSIQNIGSACDLINKLLLVIDSHKKIYYLNSTAEKYFATSNDYACGKDYSEIIRIMDLSGVDTEELFDDKNNIKPHGHGIIRGGDEVKYYISFKADEIFSEDREERYGLFIFEDISDKEALKKQLKHKRRLEVLGDLSAGIVYDVNNILGSILGSAEMLADELSNNKHQSKLSQTIIKSVNAAADLSKKLLKFSKPAEPVFELIDIHELLDEILEILRSSIGDNVKLNSEFINKEVILFTDRAELEIVLFNIVLSSQDALQNGGIISFITDIVDNEEEILSFDSFKPTAKSYFKITIADNGRAVTESTQHKVFNKDYNAKLLNEGEGSGLCAVHDIMEHLRGGIEVVSEPDGMSQFDIYLPLSGGIPKFTSLENKQLIDDRDLLSVEKSMVVLVVDGNNVIRESIKDILLAMGCEVFEACNGKQALELFKENSEIINLVLLDVALPVKDGKEALIEIREMDKNVEIIMTSGYFNQLSQSVLSEFGANGYLTKPYKIEEIKNLVQNLNSEKDGINDLDAVLSSIEKLNLDERYSDIEDGTYGKIELMLVENNHNIRELLYTILSESRFDVTVFESVESAKNAIKSGRYFALSVIDIDFSNENDKELFLLLKNNDDNLPRYIIASSSKDVEQVALRALKLGVDDFILKPFSLNFMKIRLEIARRYIETEQMKNKIQSMLKESEERMSLAINGVGIGMWDWKINEKEFFASSKCKEIFGYTDGLNIGVLDYLYSVTIKEDQYILTKEFSNYLRKPEGILNIEFRTIHPVKGEIWILAIAKLFDDTKNGKPKRLIGISMDITERKREEYILREESQKLEEMVVQRTAELLKSNEKLSKEIEAREKAELKNLEQQLKLMDADKLASLGILVSGIGHEINNPIQFIMFNLPFIKNAWESALPILDKYYESHPDFELRGVPYSLAKERLPNMANDVIEGAERISSIVKELREYSRKSRTEELKEEDIVDVVLSAKSLFSKFNGIRDVDIGLHTPGEHIVALLNRTRVEQVLLNLLQNALQALDKSEKKKIKIDLKYSDDNQYIEINVVDNGVGIKKEHMKHLTDPFFTTRSSDGGTGLGLAMCKKIIHDHSGELLFESEYGKGTIVKVLIPIKKSCDL